MTINSIAQNSLLNQMRNVERMHAAATERLATGLRVNSASHDAVALAISERMRAQVNGMDMASRNAQNGISMIQTAEGGLSQLNEKLQRARELTVQAANGTNSDATRSILANEISQIFKEINSMADRVEFNGKKLLNGLSNVHLQVGANANQSMSFNIGTMSVAGLGLSDVQAAAANGFSGMSGASIAAMVSNFDNALGAVASERANLGATQNRLEHTMRSLDTSSINLQSSMSRLIDADLARSMVELTLAQILFKANLAVISQANQKHQNIFVMVR